ncbi:MAG TPA: low molecular weight protein-tyrosine-phosphatase [Bacteroidales bacterium]|nr:low molecular weight protein-tyrosine-phosphatase [Bacteroidales bacterium]
MKKILMICLGNICRSPLAASILRKKINESGIAAIVDSAGFEPYHIGDNADGRTIEVARKNGVAINNHSARLFSATDFDNYDHIYVMDQRNYRDVMFMARNQSDKQKVDYLMNTVSPGKNQIIPDPYYGDGKDFDTVFKLMDQACTNIVKSFSANKDG